MEFVQNENLEPEINRSDYPEKRCKEANGMLGQIGGLFILGAGFAYSAYAIVVSDFFVSIAGKICAIFMALIGIYFLVRSIKEGVSLVKFQTDTSDALSGEIIEYKDYYSKDGSGTICYILTTKDLEKFVVAFSTSHKAKTQYQLGTKVKLKLYKNYVKIVN